MSGAAAAEQRIRDIEKAFDRVWHDCLLSKLKPLAISWKMLRSNKLFLSNSKLILRNRHQIDIIILSGQSSK